MALRTNNIVIYHIMVFRRRKPSTTYKRRRTFRKKRKTVNRISKNLISDSTIVKLKYVTQFQLNPTTGAVAQKTISANVANAPEAASGHQPMGWDQWVQFYDKYTVLGSKCTIMAHTTTTTSSGQNILAIRLLDSSNDAPTLTGVTDLLEQRGTTYRPITNMTGQGTVMVSKNYSARKHHGKDISSQQGRTDDSKTVTTLDGNYTPQVDFEIILLPTDSSQDPAAVFCTATISYIVKFNEPKSLSSS